VLADVGFLAMDLERLGAPEAAAAFLADYRQLTGDTWPDSLAHHYVAYRAQVRAKVACLRSDQGDSTAAAAAGQLLGLALAHLRAGEVTLTLVGGLPGTGKSRLAREVGRAKGWLVLRSDEIRKQLAGLGPLERTGDAYDRGLYDPRSARPPMPRCSARRPGPWLVGAR